MNTFIITLLVISTAIFAMSAGAIFFNLRFKGSCGGDKEICKKCLNKISSP
jgi:hypothetical protein